MGIFEKIFGNYSEKEVKRIRPIVAKINDLEPQFEALSDEQLRARPMSISKGLPRALLWTTFCPRHLPR